MEGSSGGTYVPSMGGLMKDETQQGSSSVPSEEEKYESALRARANVDKDFLCPICFQTMEDAFLTFCGHSFCYTCIMTHLNNRNNCPSCARYLTNDQLIPNILLSKLMKKASASQLLSNASPAEHLSIALQQGADLPAKELDTLLLLLGEKKRKLEEEELESNMELLLEFLHRSSCRKQQELHEVEDDLQFLKEDIATVEKRLQDLLRAKDTRCKKLRLLTGALAPDLDTHPGRDEASDGATVGVWGGGRAGAFTPPSEQPFSVGCLETGKSIFTSGNDGLGNANVSLEKSLSDLQGVSAGVLMKVKKNKVLEQFEDLQEAYLMRRRQVAALKQKKLLEAVSELESGWDIDILNDGLDDFQSVLSAFTRYSCLRVIAEVHQGDLFHTSNIVSSIEFDRDDELFATAGVSRRIKVFDFATVVSEVAIAHCPIVEIPTRSKLSCLSWNKSTKPLIASSDYEGIVTVWDVSTKQSVLEYEEHEKRAWSVDFSRTDPSMLVSGSDDCKVKVWCTRQESSALNIDMKANICCVKYNPGSGNHIAVGSVDHHIHYYDLRNVSVPLHVFKGHQKAVSYVKFLSSNELASASTDSTLRLWDVRKNCSVRTLKGHTNEKNFVGLTVNKEYIACGSETNEVFVYHKAMSRPTSSHRFGSPNPEDSDDDTSNFISAVCWKSDSLTMLVANSQGTIKVLAMAP